MMKLFYSILANTLVASITNTFVWFAVTFWVYLQTRSVITTAVMAGIYTVTVAFSGFLLGSLVDRYPKKTAMMVSSLTSFLLYAIAGALYVSTPEEVFLNPSSVQLWVFIVLILTGAIAGNLRGIALLTLITIMFSEEERDKINGLVGSVNGVAFLVGSIVSGVVIGFLGMVGMLGIALALLLMVIVHLWTLPIPQQEGDGHTEAHTNSIDLRGTIQVIGLVPGLFGLIFFQTFNNLLSGVHMALMDAYGLELVSVQVWGALWGFLSLAFILGGLIVAKKGLGKNPLQTLFLANVVVWTICMFFTIQASIVLFTVGIFICLCLFPVIEASEQTILQKVIPPDRQGRVFGFAQSVELSATPLTSFLIGPIAQWYFIPYMTTGAGVELIGSWYGTGVDRGIALLFTVAGFIGLLITLFAMSSRAFRMLSSVYQREPEAEAEDVFMAGAPLIGGNQ